jgi:hypothetical protein
MWTSVSTYTKTSKRHVVTVSIRPRRSASYNPSRILSQTAEEDRAGEHPLMPAPASFLKKKKKAGTDPDGACGRPDRGSRRRPGRCWADRPSAPSMDGASQRGGVSTPHSCVWHRHSNRVCILLGPTAANSSLNSGPRAEHVYRNMTQSPDSMVLIVLVWLVWPLTRQEKRGGHDGAHVERCTIRPGRELHQGRRAGRSATEVEGGSTPTPRSGDSYVPRPRQYIFHTVSSITRVYSIWRIYIGNQAVRKA